jgi:hypothetical protein
VSVPDALAYVPRLALLKYVMLSDAVKLAATGKATPRSVGPPSAMNV